MTEHIEGDLFKFALWSGRSPSSDNKTVLKVRSAEMLLEQTFIHRRPSCNVGTVPPAGLQHGSQTGVDQKHQGGDPGEDDSAEGRAEGASFSAQNTGADQTQEPHKEVKQHR